MHQFVGIVDPNSTTDHADSKKCTHMQAKCIVTLLNNPKPTKNQDELKYRPNFGD